jgi:hypothetical protein
MAAPTYTPRVAPTGDRLDDGYQALVTLAVDTDIKLWEKSTTPPSVNGGDPIDTTTQHNVTYETQSPRALKKMEGGSMTVAYDPAVYPQIIAVINVLTVISILFPNGAKLSYWGWLRSFEPAEMTPGEQPTATANFEPANQDASGVEQAPVYGT